MQYNLNIIHIFLKHYLMINRQQESDSDINFCIIYSWDFLTKIVYACLFSSTHAAQPIHLIFLHMNNLYEKCPKNVMDHNRIHIPFHTSVFGMMCTFEANQ